MTEQQVEKLKNRFYSKVNKTESCWLWTRGLDGNGYGSFGIGTGKCYSAHRVSLWLDGRLESYTAKKDKSDYVDHICRVPTCVNPEHLRVVTHKVNILENSLSVTAINANKTHCNHGHEFTPENTYYRKENNCRYCKKCSCRRSKTYLRKKKLLCK